jgi:hypothetical protein
MKTQDGWTPPKPETQPIVNRLDPAVFLQVLAVLGQSALVVRPMLH